MYGVEPYIVFAVLLLYRKLETIIGGNIFIGTFPPIKYETANGLILSYSVTTIDVPYWTLMKVNLRSRETRQ